MEEKEMICILVNKDDADKVRQALFINDIEYVEVNPKDVNKK